MKRLFPWSCAALVAPILAIGAQPSHADPVWRCDDEPGLPECEEALLNDIEDIIIFDWPVVLDLALPPLPYTCNKKPGTGHQIVEGDQGPTPQFTSQMPLTLKWTGDLRSFLIGRHTAAADLIGSVDITGWATLGARWTNQTINYLFNEGTTDVQAHGGSTGVRDLGAVSHAPTTAGDFWGAMLPLEPMDGDGDWTCIVGPSGRQVTAQGKNIVQLDYPVAWLPIQDVLAEGAREQFRRAVRIAVNGPEPTDCMACH